MLMKKAPKILLSLIFFVTASVYGGNTTFLEETKPLSQKTYVDLMKVYLNESGIWVEENGNFFLINSLHFDQQGYYYNFQQAWGCPRCGAENPMSSSICQVCKWPLFDDYQKR